MDIRQANAYEMLEELSKREQWELEVVLEALLHQKKIDFIALSNSYTANLTKILDKEKDKVRLSNGCLLGLLTTTSKPTKKNEGNVKTALFVLDKSNSFQIKPLAERLNVDIDSLQVADCIPPFFTHLYDE